MDTYMPVAPSGGFGGGDSFAWIIILLLCFGGSLHSAAAIIDLQRFRLRILFSQKAQRLDWQFRIRLSRSLTNFVSRRSTTLKLRTLLCRIRSTCSIFPLLRLLRLRLLKISSVVIPCEVAYA